MTQNDTLLELLETGKIPAKPEDANTGVPEQLVRKQDARYEPQFPQSFEDEDEWYWNDAA